MGEETKAMIWFGTVWSRASRANILAVSSEYQNWESFQLEYLESRKRKGKGEEQFQQHKPASPH